MTFARHHTATRWCTVVETGASIVTKCRGRFSATDAHETADDVPLGDMCGGCEPSAQVEAGLRELARA